MIRSNLKLVGRALVPVWHDYVTVWKMDLFTKPRWVKMGAGKGVTDNNIS